VFTPSKTAISFLLELQQNFPGHSRPTINAPIHCYRLMHTQTTPSSASHPLFFRQYGNDPAPPSLLTHSPSGFWKTTCNLSCKPRHAISDLTSSPPPLCRRLRAEKGWTACSSSDAARLASLRSFAIPLDDVFTFYLTPPEPIASPPPFIYSRTCPARLKTGLGPGSRP